jgi:hypothetical protein
MGWFTFSWKKLSCSFSVSVSGTVGGRKILAGRMNQRLLLCALIANSSYVFPNDHSMKTNFVAAPIPTPSTIIFLVFELRKESVLGSVYLNVK